MLNEPGVREENQHEGSKSVLTAGQSQIAKLLYGMAVQHGASPQRAREFVAAAYAESTLNPGAVNRSSKAGGLFQLLSPGYRQKAQKLGGVFNPRANALAILPDYQRYWQQHPNAAPGQAASAVERSGQGAGFYAKPLSQLGQFGGGVAPAMPRPPAPSTGGLAATPGIAQSLMSLATQQHPNYQPLFGLVQQAKQSPQTPQAPRQTLGNVAAGPQRGLGRAILAPGADRPGVKTSPAVLRFVQRIAGLAGHPLTIGTGSNHSRMTVNGRVSDHWAGRAADIPATGQQLVELGRWALIAAGANPRWALKQTGGLFNIGGHQIIFNTHEGGDHTNHLHVSA